MFNKYFPDGKIDFNNIYFMIGYVARKRHLQNFEVLICINRDDLYHLLSCAEVLHCENFDKTADSWVHDYNLPEGNFHFDNVDPELDVHIPSETRIGKVFAKLITGIAENTGDEDILGLFYKVFNSPITLKINDYNCSAFYEPDFVQMRAYYNESF